MKLFWCCGFPEIYAQLEERVGSVYHGILLYVKLLWCSMLHRSIVNNGGGVNLPGYMCILLYMKHISCSGFPEIYAQLEKGV